MTPGIVTGVAWTCIASEGSSCPASGNGLKYTKVDILPGGVVNFALQGEVVLGANGMLVHSTEVIHVGDLVLDYNLAVDSDALVNRCFIPFTNR